MSKRVYHAIRVQLALAGVLLLMTLAEMNATAADSVEKLLKLNTRPGVTVEVLLLSPPDPVAILILLEGGGGDIRLSGTKSNHGGFLSTSRGMFAAHGLAVALVNAPSDEKGKRSDRKVTGMSGLFRTNRKHLVDIEAVAAHLERELGVPIWLVGISRGSQSAAHIAIHTNRRFGGLVLLSSMTTVPDRSLPVPAMALERIAVPALVIAHRDDGCSFTPASGAALIEDGLTNAALSEVLYVEGGRNIGKNPCKPRTHHTFFGMERDVVFKISGFVAANLDRNTGPRAQSLPDGYLTRGEIEKILIGNTVMFTGRGGQPISVYFDGGGEAIVVRMSEAKRQFRKKWWLRDDGVLCRTVGRENTEQCTNLGRGDKPQSVEFFATGGRRMFEAVILEGRQLSD